MAECLLQAVQRRWLHICCVVTSQPQPHCTAISAATIALDDAGRSVQFKIQVQTAPAPPQAIHFAHRRFHHYRWR